MRSNLLNRCAPFLLVAAVMSAGAITSCTRNRDVYDSSYNDRHQWNRREDAAYRRWEADRRLDHLEYARRNAEEQRAYWAWRHEHPD